MSSHVISRPKGQGRPRPGVRLLTRPAALLGAAALLAGGIAACGSSSSTAAGAEKTLTITLALGDTEIDPVTDSALRLAATLGFYAKNHLKVNMIGLTATPQEVDALKSGQVQIADIAVDSALEIQEKKLLNIRAIGAADLGAPYVIAASTSIKTVAQLAGKTYGISAPGGVDDQMTEALLKAYKVNPSSLNYVSIGAPAERAEALAAGRVAATAVSAGSYEPIQNAPGVHLLVGPKTFYDKVPIQSKFVVAETSTIKKDSAAIQRFVTAQIETARYLSKHEAVWVKDMHAQRPDLSVADLQATYQTLTGRWCVNGCLNTQQIGTTMKFLQANDSDEAGLKAIPESKMIDQTYINSAIKTLGAATGSVDTA